MAQLALGTMRNKRAQLEPASWAGVCPGNYESAGKRTSGRTRKGNVSLRTALVEEQAGSSEQEVRAGTSQSCPSAIRRACNAD